MPEVGIESRALAEVVGDVVPEGYVRCLLFVGGVGVGVDVGVKCRHCCCLVVIFYQAER